MDEKQMRKQLGATICVVTVTVLILIAAGCFLAI